MHCTLTHTDSVSLQVSSHMRWDTCEKAYFSFLFFAWSVKMTSTGLCKAASISFSHHLTNFRIFKPRCRTQIILQPLRILPCRVSKSFGNQTSCNISKFFESLHVVCTHPAGFLVMPHLPVPNTQQCPWFSSFLFRMRIEISVDREAKEPVPPPLPYQGSKHKKLLLIHSFIVLKMKAHYKGQNWIFL